MAWQNDFELKVLYLVPLLLFACCVTVSAVGNPFEDENSDSNAKFCRGCPSYTYEINKSVNLFKYLIIFWGSQSLKCPKLNNFAFCLPFILAAI